MSNVVFGMHDENEADIFRPETTDIFIENYEDNVPTANASNASISSYVNNIECMDPHGGEVRQLSKFSYAYIIFHIINIDGKSILR